MTARAVSHHLQTRGLRLALLEAFNDGAWHYVEEIVAAARPCISQQQAMRTSLWARPNNPTVEHGLLRLGLMSLGDGWISVEWDYGPGGKSRHGGRRRRRFRILDGPQTPRLRPRFSEQAVIDIKLRLAQGEAAAAIAAELGVAESTIYSIRRGEYYRTVAVTTEPSPPAREE